MNNNDVQIKKTSKADKIRFILSIIFIFLSGVLFALSFSLGQDEKITYIIPNSSFKVGDSYNLNANYKDKELNYVSETPLIVEVDKETGEITAKKEGTAVIKIYVKDDPEVSKNVTINVKPNTSKEDVVNPTQEQEPEEDVQEQVEEQTQVENQETNDNKNNPKKIEPTKPVTPTPAPQQETTQEQPTNPTTNVVRVIGLSLSAQEINLNVGDSEKVTATVLPTNATNKKVIWSSNDTSIATVDSNGNIKGISAGTASITATTEDGGFNKTVTVNVTNAVVEVTNILLNPNTKTYLAIGKTIKIEATVVPSNANNKAILWSSSDSNVANVDQKGTVKGVRKGIVQISAIADMGKVRKGVIIEVIPTRGIVKFGLAVGHSVSNNSSEPSYYYCKEGQNFDALVTTISGDTNVVPTIKTYSSSNTAKAIVTASTNIAECANCKMININCKKEGNTTITATSSLGGSNTINVIVVDKDAPDGIPQPDGTIIVYSH